MRMLTTDDVPPTLSSQTVLTIFNGKRDGFVYGVHIVTDSAMKRSHLQSMTTLVAEMVTYSEMDDVSPGDGVIILHKLPNDSVELTFSVCNELALLGRLKDSLESHGLQPVATTVHELHMANIGGEDGRSLVANTLTLSYELLEDIQNGDVTVIWQGSHLLPTDLQADIQQFINLVSGTPSNVVELGE